MITDELREWAHNHVAEFNIGGVDGRDLLAIADRIDEQHEQMQYDYQHEFDGWKFIRDTQWVELPKDADGVPIHVGDELDGLHYEDGTVTGIQYGTDGRTMIAVRPNGWDTSTWRDPEEYCHRIADSWERIIEDAQEYVTDDEPLYSVSELVERCRRLAGAE